MYIYIYIYMSDSLRRLATRPNLGHPNIASARAEPGRETVARDRSALSVNRPHSILNSRPGLQRKECPVCESAAFNS